jgi:casein kinase 1
VVLNQLKYFIAIIFFRDSKPDNFVLGRGDKSETLYIVEYGLSKRFIDSKTG